MDMLRRLINYRIIIIIIINAVRQSVKDRSDGEVWIGLSEEPCLEMLTE